MLIDEFLAKYNEAIGQQKLDLLALIENHNFDDLKGLSQVNKMQGRIQGLNAAHAIMRGLYDSVYNKPTESVTVSNEGITKDVKPSLY